MNAIPGHRRDWPAEPMSGVVGLARRFPSSFTWGVATSAFQIEGATQEDGRGESIWDRFCSTPGNILDGSDGRQACDHYHRVEQDVELLQRLGIRDYRFSIAWPRVQPEGTGSWNEAGFAFYDRLLSLLAARGIEAHATLYHWDLPQALQDAGGWANPATIKRFVDYSCEVGRRFGARLKSLSTINEPWVVACLGHETGLFAPGIKDRRQAFQVSHHLLLAHGHVLQALRQQGVGCPLGIVLNLATTDPLTDSAADRARATLEDGLLLRWYVDPLLRGHYPQDVLDHLGGDAPRVAPGDMACIQQPLDFLGINFYCRNVVAASGPVSAADRGCVTTAMGWEVRAASLSELLLRLQRDYTLPPLYIMENGAAFEDAVVDGQVHDVARRDYIATHIGAAADALEAGVDLRGYFVWSLFDNFEWAQGYRPRFGIVYVDYATFARLPKDSAWWFSDLVKQHRRIAGVL
ncbi:MAG: hypothetical protein RL026_1826 [Pseudomonadota bacterium]|jgi:beta-glucosidase